MSTWKKTHKVRAENFSFTWGLTEDYSPGDSLSDNPGELLQRGKAGGQQPRGLQPRGYVQPSNHLGRRLLLVTRNRYLS